VVPKPWDNRGLLKRPTEAMPANRSPDWRPVIGACPGASSGTAAALKDWFIFMKQVTKINDLRKRLDRSPESFTGWPKQIWPMAN
jgi:hypothetical protein